MTVKIPGYKILGTLGKGGMATVYLAEHEIFQRKVALKVMAPALADDPSFGERFIREARIVSQLVHPHIVTVYDVGVHEGNYYLSMEFIDGKDLKHARRHLSLEQKIHVILDIAKALEYAGNKGYVHRDIKPENIMLYEEDCRAVLTDFGIARAAEMEISFTQTGTAIGTPHYMSPEQAKGQPVDIRSDIYGLGVVFYLLLVGCVPYDAESAVAIGIKHITDPIPQLPEGLEALQPVIDKMMAKLPKDRYQKPAQLVQDLSRLNLSELLAAADAASAKAEESLSSASADAPTIVSRAAARGGADVAIPPRADDRAAQATDDDDPTPIVVEEPFEFEDHDTTVWPWVAGLMVLLTVVGGVFYSQHQQDVHAWFADQWSTPMAASVTDDGVGTTRPDESAAQAAQVPVPKEGESTKLATPESAQAGGEGTQSAVVEQNGGQNQAAEDVQARIDALNAQLPTDPAVLQPLVDAWRELESLAPERNAEAAIAELVAGEAARIRQLITGGSLQAADMRLQQLQSLPPEVGGTQVEELQTLLVEQQQIQQWLEEGQAFLASDTLTQPAEDNAHARFRQVLALEPDNVAAQEGITQVAERLVELARQAVQKSDLKQAETLLARTAEVDPTNPAVPALRRELEAQAQQASVNQRVASLLQKGEAQMREASYFSPPDQSAYHYFKQALELQPDNTAVQKAISRTITEFDKRLFNLLAEDHFEVVRNLVQTARDQLPLDERLAALEIRVEEAIAEKLLARQPRVLNIVVTGGPSVEGVSEQPAVVEADRTISVGFDYGNFKDATSVINAILMDGTRSLQIAQVPVVITGNEGSKAFRIDRPVEGFSSGRYTIDLMFKGNRLATRDFQVK